MLSKRKRINKESFQIVFKKGRIVYSPFFSFYYLPQKNPQYSFVVSKNVCNKAVGRNKLKRLGYNTLRSLDINNGIGIFFYKKNSIKADKEEIKKDIIFLLKKAKLK